MAKCIEKAEDHCKSYPRCYGCNAYREPTNADCIRAMSDEELADHNIHTVKVWNRYEGYHEIEYRCSDGYTTGIYDFALRHEMDWLKQPVKDGEKR